jgi:hypothetical protein
MELDHSADGDERASLLGRPDVSQSSVKALRDPDQSWVLYEALLLVFLFQAGVALPVVPSTSILENALCSRLHGSLRDCKDEAVQSRLAMLKGVSSFVSLIPGTPYASSQHGPTADTNFGAFCVGAKASFSQFHMVLSQTSKARVLSLCYRFLESCWERRGWL